MNLAEHHAEATRATCVAAFRLALAQAHQPGTSSNFALFVALLGESWRLLLLPDADSTGGSSLLNLASSVDDDVLRQHLGALDGLMARPDITCVLEAMPLFAPLLQACVDGWLARAGAQGLDALGPAGQALARVNTDRDFDRYELAFVVGDEVAAEIIALAGEWRDSPGPSEAPVATSEATEESDDPFAAIPPDARLVFDELVEGKLSTADGLRTMLRNYRLTLKTRASSGHKVDIKFAFTLCDVASELLNSIVPSTPEATVRLIHAAVDYLMLLDDGDDDFESSHGFDDDAIVINAVAKAVGRDDLLVLKRGPDS